MDELSKLREARKAAVDTMEAAHKAWSDAVESQDESQDLDELRSAFDAAERKADQARDRLEAAIRLDEAKRSLPVEPIEADETPEQRDGTSPKVEIRREQKVYEKGDARSSYFRDLYLAKIKGDSAAQDRIQRHGQQVDVELRDISTTDTAGGEFVPPLWLVDEYAALARAGRVTADLIGSRPLPGGTDSISVPRITTGSAVAVQATENNTIQETDLVTDSVSSDVTTIAGMEDVSVQLLEQSPIAFDQVIAGDLAADYARKFDQQILAGSGSSNQLNGILGSTGAGISGSNVVTYTATTPVASGLYPKVADAVQQVATGRFAPAQAIVMHPRRWAFLLASLDTSDRPLIVPSAGGPNNAMGLNGQVAAEAFVGTLQGLPVFVDPNITTTSGASTNEDRIIVFRPSDALLWEGTPKAEVFRETLSGALTVRFRLYCFAALIANRWPAGISVIKGTGLATPTF